MKRQFFGYALGSALESQYWLDRALARNLLRVKNGFDLITRMHNGVQNIQMLIDDLPRK